MTSLIPFVERRSSARLKETPCRRRNGQVRPPHAGPHLFSIVPELLERRRTAEKGLDVATTLELNLDRFPTKSAMLTFLKTQLYNVESDELAARRPDYVKALGQAVDVLEHSPDPCEAVATLRGYQAYMAARETLPH